MIRLVVISDSPPTITPYFDQPKVIIGSTNSPLADLALKEESLNDIHIQITLENNKYYSTNVASDPFATLNGRPFGKKLLKPNDILQIGNATIRIELEQESSIVKEQPHLTQPLNQQIKKEEPFQKKESPLKDDPEVSNVVDTKELLPIILEKKFEDYAEALKQTSSNLPISSPSAPSDTFSDEEKLLMALQENSFNYDDYLNYEKEASSLNIDRNYLDDSLDLSEDPFPQFNINPYFEETEITESNPLDSTPTPPQENQDPNDSAKSLSPTSLKYPDHPLEDPSAKTASPLTEQTPHPIADSFAIPTKKTTNEESTQKVSHSTPSAPTPKLSLKDYYLSEYDDVSESTAAPTETPSNTPKFFISFQNWIIYLKAFTILGIITLIALVFTYLWLANLSDKKELSASKGVADVAMALTYAQIKNIHPQNQNWADPEFIRNNLTAVLPSKYFASTDFDTHGQFADCPYFLRIYTSGDLSQFLVIAQPAPSLLQWLIPKSTIIVDSRAMEMRKIKDLKSLNRLLVNANTLDGTSAVEISNLVQQGTLIPLNSLITDTENNGFSPPKALSLIRPGAENLVYNAPRYFPLSDELIKKSLDFIEKPASSYEVMRLQQELSALKKFPDTVLYASGGIQNAIHAQKALATLSPKERFLIAYLQINNNGQLANSHLLIDDTLQEIAANDNLKHTHASENLVEDQDSVNNQPLDSKDTVEKALQGSEFDEDNPLFLQLSALNVFRQQALRSYNEEIINLLNQETQASQDNFESKIKQLLGKYVEIDNEQQAKILKKFDGIYREHPHVAASHFFHLAKAAGLKQTLKEYLINLKQTQLTTELTQEKFDTQVVKIEKATDWATLEHETSELIGMLTLDRIPDEDTIVAYQNATRSKIVQKLNQFILSPEYPHLFQSLNSEYRYTLIHILKMGWITDPDTYDFYLNEFDLRIHPRGSSQESDVEEAEE